MHGLWESPDLTAVVRVAARNAQKLRQVASSPRAGAGPAAGCCGASARATRARAAAMTIAAHYDLGNELFALMLDETMMYSSAYFPRRGMTLAQASRAKLELVCRKLGLRSRRPRARDRHGMGRLRRPRRANDRLPGHDHHDLARAVRARP